MRNPFKILPLNAIIIGVITVTASINTKAATDSLKIWRFIYEVSDVNNKERGYNDLMNLDVTSNGSSFFYSIYSQNEPNKQGENLSISNIYDQNSQKKGAHYRILRDAVKSEIRFFTDTPDNFYYKEDNFNLKWNICDKDTMSICGYACKKAKTSFAGRTWIAWFSDEIPLSCGPWKLSGLPGLILSAYDSENYFKFSCVGMEQTKSLPWKINSKHYIKCTNKEFQKQLRLHAADPVNYALRKLGLPTLSAEDATIVGEDGKSKKELPKFDTIFLEKEPGDEK